MNNVILVKALVKFDQISSYNISQIRKNKHGETTGPESQKVAHPESGSGPHCLDLC